MSQAELLTYNKAQDNLEWEVGRAELFRACAICLLVLPVWFSANAHVEEISEDFGLSTADSTLVTIAINVGFVIAATLSAIVQLADRIAPDRLIHAGSSLCASFSLILIIPAPYAFLLIARFATGASISLIYPPLIRYVSSWFKLWRGLALGCTIGSFTVAVALPNLLKAMFPGTPWRALIAVTSIMALFANILACGMRTGPYLSTPAALSCGAIFHIISHREWLLVTLSYMGHSFELFGGWAWMGAFLQDVFRIQGITDPGIAPATSFIVVGIGSIGCVFAGGMADKIDRRWIIAVSHLISGTALAALPVTASFSPSAFVCIVAGLWGLTVNADSAQYQAMLADTMDESILGTAVALSIAFGFVMTAVGIYILPFLLETLGWIGAFPCLALGPAVGLVTILLTAAPPLLKS